MGDLASCRLVYRKLWDHDRPDVAAHLRRLGPAERHERFLRATRDEASDAYVAGLDPHRALLLGCFVDGVLRGVAELHLGVGNRFGHAEAAFSVERDFQGHGVGRALMERVVTAARNRGVRLLWLLCLAENHRMRRIAHGFGLAATVEAGEVVGVLHLPPPNVATLLAEAMEDGQAAVRKAAALAGALGCRLAGLASACQGLPSASLGP
jgi:GNAT superfamily N-acetyltransferase